MTTPTSPIQSIDEILDKYVANYNLEVLGFRQSGQAEVKRQLLEYFESLISPDLELRNPKARNYLVSGDNLVMSDEQLKYYEMGHNTAKQQIRERIRSQHE